MTGLRATDSQRHRRSNERAFTLAKQKSRGKIDAAYALMMFSTGPTSDQKPRSPLVVL